MYICPEPRAIRNRLLTKSSPLCSPAKARFVDIFFLCSPMLPRCSLMLFLCSLVLARYSTVLSLSHFLLLYSLSNFCKFKRDPWCS